MMEDFGAITFSSLVVVFFQKYLKGTAKYAAFVKAFPGADKWAHRAFAAAASLVSIVVAHYTVMGDWHSGWHLTVEIPDGWTLLHGLRDWAGTFMGQQWMYATMNQRPWKPGDSGIFRP